VLILLFVCVSIIILFVSSITFVFLFDIRYLFLMSITAVICVFVYLYLDHFYIACCHTWPRVDWM